MLKDIKGFEEKYQASEDGRIYSIRNKKFLKPFVDGKGRYEYVTLISNKKFAVHRLVAQAFIPNPENKPEVDHKDNNTHNNELSNLQWVTRKENMKRAFETISPVRNYKECSLYKGDEIIGKFKSVKSCAKWCNENFGLSISSLDKYRKYKDYAIRCND